jgi:tyrosinase
MPIANTVKTRFSVSYLQSEYDKGNKQPLEDLVRAWKGIQELDPSDKRSFFVLGGYHGEPFSYRRAVDALSPSDIYTYWGGWCNHGNVLFPTWHRVYLHKLEEALQSIVPGVTLPFWDETDEESMKNGIPQILTQEQFELDGVLIDNPLRSFTLPAALSDDVPGDDEAYVKPAGYETVRYPLSGLVGTREARAATARHNEKYPSPSENTQLLNQNIVAWLKGSGPGGPTDPDAGPGPTPADPDPAGNGVRAMFQACLSAPNYTVFSNTTSAGQWNLDHPGEVVVPLEQPHNDIHLAVGGFDIPGQGESGQIAEANGDMGENNTAGLDPIFFFHHAHIDRMFWLWQKRHRATDSFDIIPLYYGTSSSDAQGPTPGIAPGTPLDMTTPLNPFVKDEFGNVFTSKDCINIEKQLGYTYGPGSLEAAPPLKAAAGFSTRKLTVRGIDRALFEGSFVIRAFATIKDDRGGTKRYYLGDHAVLSRRNVVKCANCLTHLEVIAHFPLRAIPEDLVDKAEYSITIQHRGSSKPTRVDRLVGIGATAVAAAAGVGGTAAAAAVVPKTSLPAKLKYEIRVID